MFLASMSTDLNVYRIPDLLFMHASQVFFAMSYFYSIPQKQSMLIEMSYHTKWIYRKIFNTRRTKSPNLNVSRLGLQLPLRTILKPSVKWRMKM